MKIEEASQGLKVKMPTQKTAGLTYANFRVFMDKQAEGATYGVISRIYQDNHIEVKFIRNDGDFIRYSFSIEDLEPYEEDVEHPTAFVLGTEVEAHQPIVGEEAVQVEGVRTFQDDVETTQPKHKDWEMGSSSMEHSIAQDYLEPNTFGDNNVNNTIAEYGKKHNVKTLDEVIATSGVAEEVKTKVQEKIGLRYNDGKLDYTLMDLGAFKPMIQVLEYGAHKYSVFENEFGAHIKGADVDKETVKLYNMKLVSSGRDNWKLGGPNMTLLKLTSSLFRHLAALLGGEDNDEESKLPHIGHIQCNVMFIGYHFLQHVKNKKAKQKTIFDDRFKKA